MRVIFVAMNRAISLCKSRNLQISGHACIGEAIAFALDSKNPLDLADGRLFEGWLFRFLGEMRRTEAAAAETLTICEQHGFQYWADMSRILVGWARAQLGRTGESVSLICEGLNGLVGAGVKMEMTDFLTCHAEVLVLTGMYEDALETLEEALFTNSEERVFRANILRWRGELRLKLNQTELAELDFREAIGLARNMNAKAWELRATTSFARLLVLQDRGEEARTTLGKIYGWFTEGFDTADLKDAKALLEELSG
jgi:predicted ATPase